MSKIWLLLLLVGAIQFARAFPALEEEKDIDELSSSEFDTSDEERGFKDWCKEAWKTIKKPFKKVGKKVSDCFKKGKEHLKKIGIKSDGLKCANSECQTCLKMGKKKVCPKMAFKKEKITISVHKQKDEEEPEIFIPPFDISIGNIPTCKSLGNVLGPLCIQGLEAEFKSKDNKPHMNCCGVLFLKKWSCGAKICIMYKEGKFNMKFEPTFFAGDEDKNVILQAGEKDDEGKPVDAFPE